LPDIVASVRDERGIGSVDNDTEDDNLLLLPLLLVKLNFVDVLLLKLCKEVERFFLIRLEPPSMIVFNIRMLFVRIRLFG
jgi:hypothetical protein